MTEKNQCPDRDCHEKVSGICDWIWGKSQANGANADIKEIKQILDKKITWRWSVFIPMFLFVVLPAVVWAWSFSAEIDHRVTRLERQNKQIERIDENIQVILERLPE